MNLNLKSGKIMESINEEEHRIEEFEEKLSQKSKFGNKL